MLSLAFIIAHECLMSPFIQIGLQGPRGFDGRKGGLKFYRCLINNATNFNFF